MNEIQSNNIMWTIRFSLIVAVLGYGLLDHARADISIECPPGWIRLHRVSCFLFETSKKKWNDAQKFCQDKQGSLSVVRSLAERDALVDHLKREHPRVRGWHAGFKKEDGVWRTTDDNQLMSMNEREIQWRNKRLSMDPRRDCGMLDFDGAKIYYSSIQCKRARKPFICEYQGITAAPSTEPTTILVTEKPEQETTKLVPVVKPTDSPAPTTLSKSDVAKVFEVTTAKSTKPVPAKPAPTSERAAVESVSTRKPIEIDSQGDGDEEDENDNDDSDKDDNDNNDDKDDDSDDDTTVRVSRSTKGLEVSTVPTGSPDISEVEDGDSHEETTKSSGHEFTENPKTADEDVSTKPVTSDSIEDKDNSGPRSIFLSVLSVFASVSLLYI